MDTNAAYGLVVAVEVAAECLITIIDVTTTDWGVVTLVLA